MYYAQMYCYGSDPREVGITGIKGCMGIVYHGSKGLYAVHIPPGKEEEIGGKAFAEFVRKKELIFGGRNAGGKLIGIVNGINRTKAKEELQSIGKFLDLKDAELYRIMKNLGDSKDKNEMYSVAVRVRLLGNVLQMTYKPDKEVEWVNGGGEDRKGGYGLHTNNPQFTGKTAPREPLNGDGGAWHALDRKNCTYSRIIC